MGILVYKNISAEPQLYVHKKTMKTSLFDNIYLIGDTNFFVIIDFPHELGKIYTKKVSTLHAEPF